VDEYWIDVASLLHIAPWDVRRLTVSQWEDAKSVVDNARKDAKKR